MYLSQPLLLPLSCRPPLLPSSDPLSLAVSLSLASLYILPSPLVSSSPIVSLSLTGPLCLLSLSLYVSPPLSHPISLTLTTALLLLFSLNLTLSPPLLNKMSYSPCPFHVVSTEMAPFSLPFSILTSSCPSTFVFNEMGLFSPPLHHHMSFPMKRDRSLCHLMSFPITQDRSRPSLPSYVVSNKTGPFLPSHPFVSTCLPSPPCSRVLFQFCESHS